MIRKALVLTILAIFCASSFAMAADVAKKATPIVAGKTTAGTVRQIPSKSEFAMIAGKVEKIDSSDPANVRITVKNDKDGASRTLTIMPWTNITKSVDISELKTGETIRVMTRKTQDKDIAMGIMFGKMLMPPPPRPAQPAQPSRTAAQAKVQAKK